MGTSKEDDELNIKLNQIINTRHHQPGSRVVEQCREDTQCYCL